MLSQTSATLSLPTGVNREMNLLSTDYIVKNGEQWNKEWIKGDGLNHWLASNWKILHHQSETFVSTSCEVTAAVIRWKSGFGDDWSLIDSQPSFDEVLKKSRYFQVSIGEDWMDCEHILTIWDTEIIQSYYKKYKIQSSSITPEFIRALENISSPGNYEKVTGVDYENSPSLQIFYWIPPHITQSKISV